MNYKLLGIAVLAGVLSSTVAFAQDGTMSTETSVDTTLLPVAVGVASDIRTVPPTLQSPIKGSVVILDDAKGAILFRWTPISPKPEGGTTYRLKVWQLMQGQTPAQAMKSTPLLAKSVVNSTEASLSGIITGPCKPPYMCDFVWDVQVEGLAAAEVSDSQQFHLDIKGSPATTSPSLSPHPVSPAVSELKSNPMYKENVLTGQNPMHESEKIIPTTFVDKGGKVNIALHVISGEGRDDGVISEPSGSAAAFIKFDSVEGESDHAQGVGSSTGSRDIRKGTSVRLRVFDLRRADESTRSEVLLNAPTSTETVRTADDLALFILRETQADPTMEEVSFNYEKIMFKHQGSGKLLGFIPVTFDEQIVINTKKESGEELVDVGRPWYSFLVNEEVKKDELEAAAKKKKGGINTIDSFSWGASNAGMFIAISNVLKAKHDTAKNSIGNIR